jgi:Tol biopolymer transport system component/photosystem II stability/assembly factor-like uncharacterized protein
MSQRRFSRSWLLALSILVVGSHPWLAVADPLFSPVAATKGCDSGNPVISSDGKHVVLASRCDLAHRDQVGVLPNYRWYHFDSTTGAFSEIKLADDCVVAGASINADGSRIAFGAYCDATGKTDRRLHLYVVDTATGMLTHVAAVCPCFDSGLAMSTDGTSVAYASCCSRICTQSDGCYGKIFRFDSRTHQITQVSKRDDCNNQEPSISADGTRIAFWSHCPQHPTQIYQADLATGVLAPVATAPDDCGVEPPTMSADGNHIAFVSYCDLTGDNAGRHEQVFDFDVRSRNLTQLTSTVSGCTYQRPSISADGRFLAVASNCGLKDIDGSGLGIYRLEMVSRSLVQVTNRNCTDDWPSISSDGLRIAFKSYCDLKGMSRNGSTGVFLADLQAQPQQGGASPPDHRKPDWTAHGPHGFGSAFGLVALAVDEANPHTLYAATFPADVFKSSDGGTSWISANTGLRLSGASDVRAFVTDPASSGVVYAGSYGDGVFKSINGGASWKATNRGLTSLFVTALASNSVVPRTLYAATIDGGIFKSRDDGAAWSGCNAGLTDLAVLTLAIDPVTANTLYAGTSRGGIFKTTNGGSSWAPVNTGIPLFEIPAPETPPPREKPAPQEPSVVYWTVQLLAINRNAPTTIYAAVAGGVFVSTDGGTSWRAVRTDAGKRAVNALVIDPNSPRTLYEAVDGGIFKSVDGGEFWSAVPTDSFDSRVQVLAVAPTAPSILYAGTQDRGAFQSRDGGTSWTPANRGMAKLYVTAVAASQTTLFAATNNRGVFRSRDRGCSWSRVNTRLSDGRLEHVTAFAVDPVTAGTVYAGLSRGGVMKTTDDADSWRVVNAGLPHPDMPISDLVIHPAVPDTLYAARTDGVFRSTTGGDSWSSAGLTGRYVTALAIDPTASATLYASVFQGPVFKSTDGAASWTALDVLNVSWVSALAIAPTAPSALYAGASGIHRGIFRSADGGASWQPARAGLPDLDSLRISDLAVDPTRPNTIYAATRGYGVLRSSDGGESWEDISANLGTQNITTFAIDPHQPGSLYVGTDDGVYSEHRCD